VFDVANIIIPNHLPLAIASQGYKVFRYANYTNLMEVSSSICGDVRIS
jgi:hypothetical protein